MPATVDDAFAHDYRVIIPIECVADRADAPLRVNLFVMDMVSAEVLPLDRVLEHLRAVDRAVDRNGA